MPRVVVLPNPSLCPEGEVLEVPAGRGLCSSLVQAGIDIDQACGMSCSCTTCQVVVLEGADSLPPAGELEKDLVRPAYGYREGTRLSCQTIMGREDIVIEIPG